MKVTFFNIVWDKEVSEVSHLPSEVVLDIDDDIDLKEQGADVLSDKFGWCVNSVNYRIQRKGKCPKCGADLEYDEGQVQDESYFYRVCCAVLRVDRAGMVRSGL